MQRVQQLDNLLFHWVRKATSWNGIVELVGAHCTPSNQYKVLPSAVLSTALGKGNVIMERKERVRKERSKNNDLYYIRWNERDGHLIEHNGKKWKKQRKERKKGTNMILTLQL